MRPAWMSSKCLCVSVQHHAWISSIVPGCVLHDTFSHCWAICATSKTPSLNTVVDLTDMCTTYILFLLFLYLPSPLSHLPPCTLCWEAAVRLDSWNARADWLFGQSQSTLSFTHEWMAVLQGHATYSAGAIVKLATSKKANSRGSPNSLYTQGGGVFHLKAN